MGNYGSPRGDVPDPWRGQRPDEAYGAAPEGSRWAGAPQDVPPGGYRGPAHPGYRGHDEPRYADPGPRYGEPRYGGFHPEEGERHVAPQRYPADPPSRSGHDEVPPWEPGAGQSSYAAAPAPPPRRSRRPLVVVLAVTVLLVLAGGAAVYVLTDGEEPPPAAAPSAPAPSESADPDVPEAAAPPTAAAPESSADPRFVKVGQCVRNEGSVGGKPKLLISDCGPNTYEVLRRVDGTTSGERDAEAKCAKVEGYTNWYFFDSELDTLDFVLCLKQR